MMALNIAVPLTTVGDLMEGFGLLSPISPLSVDCRGVTATGSHSKKQLVSPVGSESSGVSSLDSEESKKPSSPPASPTEDVERPSTSSPLPSPEESDPKAAETEEGNTGQSSSDCSPSSSTSSLRSSLSSTDSTSTESDLNKTAAPIKQPKIVLSGRNVLDLIDNLTAPDHFRLQFAQLPENDNIHFFLDNRSQYHRLGANGHIQEFTMVKCKCCDFSYPVNGTSLTGGIPAVGTTTVAGFNQSTNLTSVTIQQHHQQQQQQNQFQLNNFANNNYNSIANSRDKMSVNVTANAFNKAFTTGTGNSGNCNNGGNQYFRNGNIAAGLFGRDSNRNTSGNSYLNSTGTYNNHKSYQQQSFGMPNNNGGKFNNSYGQMQQQQSFYAKNHSLRYGTGGNNSAGGGSQSTSSPASSGFNSVAVAAALASQNLLNFSSFNNSNNSYNNNKSNSNNMFAYYKSIM